MTRIEEAEGESVVSPTQADREAAARLLGYSGVGDMYDYRLTGSQDKQRDATVRAIANARAEGYAAAVEALSRPTPPATQTLVDALREMLRLADMGYEQAMLEPEENGSYAAYNRARAALAAHERTEHG